MQRFLVVAVVIVAWTSITAIEGHASISLRKHQKQLIENNTDKNHIDRKDDDLRPLPNVEGILPVISETYPALGREYINFPTSTPSMDAQYYFSSGKVFSFFYYL